MKVFHGYIDRSVANKIIESKLNKYKYKCWFDFDLGYPVIEYQFLDRLYTTISLVLDESIDSAGLMVAADLLKEAEKSIANLLDRDEFQIDQVAEIDFDIRNYPISTFDSNYRIISHFRELMTDKISEKNLLYNADPSLNNPIMSSVIEEIVDVFNISSTQQIYLSNAKNVILHIQAPSSENKNSSPIIRAIGHYFSQSVMQSALVEGASEYSFLPVIAGYELDDGDINCKLEIDLEKASSKISLICNDFNIYEFEEQSWMKEGLILKCEAEHRMFTVLWFLANIACIGNLVSRTLASRELSVTGYSELISRPDIVGASLSDFEIGHEHELARVQNSLKVGIGNLFGVAALQEAISGWLDAAKRMAKICNQDAGNQHERRNAKDEVVRKFALTMDADPST